MSHEYLDDDEDALRPMIHRAAGRGDVETISRILDEDAEAIHCLNELGNQPLHEACWGKHLQTVMLLVQRGADVNARGDFGQTPLHFAVRDGGEEVLGLVRMLLEAGADVMARDDRLQETALGFAVREYDGDLEPVMELLRQSGATP